MDESGKLSNAAANLSSPDLKIDIGALNQLYLDFSENFTEASKNWVLNDQEKQSYKSFTHHFGNGMQLLQSSEITPSELPWTQRVQGVIPNLRSASTQFENMAQIILDKHPADQSRDLLLSRLGLLERAVLAALEHSSDQDKHTPPHP